MEAPGIEKTVHEEVIKAPDGKLATPTSAPSYAYAGRKPTTARKPRPLMASSARQRRLSSGKSAASAPPAAPSSPVFPVASLGMGIICSVCGEMAPAGEKHGFPCSECGLVAYCCRDHRNEAWDQVHHYTCGRVLPTPKSIHQASLEDAVLAIREYGEVDPSLADSALERSIDHVNASIRWQAEDRERLVEIFRDVGGFEGVTRQMVLRPKDASLQARCAVVLSGFAEGEATCQHASDAGAFACLASALLNHSRA